jgi:predicted ATPase
MPSTNLPERVSDLTGRDDELREVVSLVASHRLVTLTGPGGIGKTRLAFAAARALLPRFPDGVWVAEFSPLSDPGLVPATVAAAAGLDLAAGEISARRVARALAGRHLLLVLDTCEHLLDAATELAEAVLRTGAGVSIIATTREPLRAEGEQIFAVPPLAVPDGEDDDPWRYGAVQLFAARSRGGGAQLAEDRRVGLAIAAICRQLDGIPLAIEMAAARAAALGLAELATHLDDRFQLLTGGRRTALPRHQTLRATLDWSFELLTEFERVILCRLAVFAGAFSLEAATAVAASGGIAPLDVVDGLGSLVAKSLVATAADGGMARYRLLDTTRFYALEKLVASGEAGAIRRRHAEWYRDLLQAAAAAATADEWPAAHRAEIDNIRVALAWAFGPEGDPAIGVALAAASVPIWFERSSLTECRGWTEQALKILAVGEWPADTEMVLRYALGYSLMVAQGTNDQARTALTRANELADSLGNLDYQLRTLAGLASICHRLQDFRAAVALGRRAEDVVRASSDPIALSMADWILGASLQLLGEYAEALTYAQRTHARTALPAVRRAHIARLGRDSHISAGATAAVVQWALGLPDQSARAARQVLADAEAGDHPVSLCLALTWCGCVIPLRLGDLHTAERSIARLKDLAQRHGLSAYFANGQCFEARLSLRRGDLAAAERLLRSGLGSLRQTQSEAFYTVFLTDLAEVLMLLGNPDESIAAADEALRRTEAANAFWWMAEALRIKGEVLLAGKGDAIAAAEHFRRSMALAHRQGGLSWELRAAMSFARSWRDRGEIGAARDLLTSVYGRFTEGFGTADLLSARTLIEACEAQSSDSG